jgi:hypothetical protein
MKYPINKKTGFNTTGLSQNTNLGEKGFKRKRGIYFPLFLLFRK